MQYFEIARLQYRYRESIFLPDQGSDGDTDTDMAGTSNALKGRQRDEINGDGATQGKKTIGNLDDQAYVPPQWVRDWFESGEYAVALEDFPLQWLSYPLRLDEGVEHPDLIDAMDDSSEDEEDYPIEETEVQDLIHGLY